ncbi:hypothetical protein JCM8097_001008 [Rhodosporidiobolus ruineniae]
MRALALPLFVSLALAALARASALPSDAASLPLDHLLTLAQSSLAQGKTLDALELYDHVLDRQPDDVATLYKRATVRLAAGQLHKAKDGFLQVLAVRDHEQAHLQLARIHAKLAEYPEAKNEIDTFLRAAKDKAGLDADVKQAKELRQQVLAANHELSAAEKALSASPPNLDRCLASSSAALSVSPQSLHLRLLRADCALLAHDFASAIGDLSRASSLDATLPAHLLVRIALLNALFTDHGLSVAPAETLLPLKRCLSADPDSKTCAKPLKALKNLEKDLGRLRNWVDAGRWTEVAVTVAGSSTKEGLLPTVQGLIEAYQRPITRTGKADESPLPAPEQDPTLATHSPLLKQLTSLLCRAYVQSGSRKAAAACAAALELDAEDTWGLVGSAEEMMKREEWEEAVRVLSAAFEATGRSDRVVLERLQKAQRLLKQSKSKDYYKVLGVARDADAKTIKRAYRKMTLKSHPDKEGGSEEKMAALNEAYEVLSNPELRARFDAGDDPNDPSSGQGGGNPFGGGSPFGAGGAGGPMFFQQSGFGGGGGGGFEQFFAQQGGGGGGQQFRQGGGGQQFQFHWG